MVQMNHQAFVEFFFDHYSVQPVKESHLPSKAGAKIVHLFLSPRAFSTFFRLFFEEES